MKKRIIATAITLLSIVFGVRAQQLIDGHEGVDLGLPSGTIWATTNVGATKAEDYGLYFAWGETIGHSLNANNCFEWENYKWCNGNSSFIQLTKYCNISGYGTIDNKTILDLEDDAAYVNWGDKWHMPTIEQVEELIRNTTQEWITISDVYGAKFTSKTNGKSIFLPAAGYGEGYLGEVAYIDMAYYGHYWSSTLCQPNPQLARSFTIYGYDGIAFANTEGRIHGCTIRPVSGILSTKISIVSAQNTDGKDVWYDLNGRRIAGTPTMKGIYILNRKKIVEMK
ncbi:MAG: hypothetical protein IJV19_05385 [Prevotella sp.]|nr:hypothetical protein [Prevotella sp.]